MITERTILDCPLYNKEEVERAIQLLIQNQADPTEPFIFVTVYDHEQSKN